MSLTHIETIELASSASSITFSSIPQTYTDLVLVHSLRTSRTGSSGALRLRAGNGSLDTGSNYSAVILAGNGSSPSSGSVTTDKLVSGTLNGATSTSNTFGNGVFYISNYASSSNKSISMDNVSENNATTAEQVIAAGLFTSSSSIDIISIFEDVSNLDAGSTVSLYGITAGGSGTVS